MIGKLVEKNAVAREDLHALAAVRNIDLVAQVDTRDLLEAPVFRTAPAKCKTQLARVRVNLNLLAINDDDILVVHRHERRLLERSLQCTCGSSCTRQSHHAALLPAQAQDQITGYRVGLIASGRNFLAQPDRRQAYAFHGPSGSRLRELIDLDLLVARISDNNLVCGRDRQCANQPELPPALALAAKGVGDLFRAPVDLNYLAVVPVRDKDFTIAADCHRSKLWRLARTSPETLGVDPFEQLAGVRVHGHTAIRLAVQDIDVFASIDRDMGRRAEVGLASGVAVSKTKYKDPAAGVHRDPVVAGVRDIEPAACRVHRCARGAELTVRAAALPYGVLQLAGLVDHRQRAIAWAGDNDGRIAHGREPTELGRSKRRVLAGEGGRTDCGGAEIDELSGFAIRQMDRTPGVDEHARDLRKVCLVPGPGGNRFGEPELTSAGHGGRDAVRHKQRQDNGWDVRQCSARASAHIIKANWYRVPSHTMPPHPMAAM